MNHDANNDPNAAMRNDAAASAGADAAFEANADATLASWLLARRQRPGVVDIGHIDALLRRSRWPRGERNALLPQLLARRSSETAAVAPGDWVFARPVSNISMPAAESEALPVVAASRIDTSAAPANPLKPMPVAQAASVASSGASAAPASEASSSDAPLPATHTHQVSTRVETLHTRATVVSASAGSEKKSAEEAQPAKPALVTAESQASKPASARVDLPQREPSREAQRDLPSPARSAGSTNRRPPFTQVEPARDSFTPLPVMQTITVSQTRVRQLDALSLPAGAASPIIMPPAHQSSEAALALRQESSTPRESEIAAIDTQPITHAPRFQQVASIDAHTSSATPAPGARVSAEELDEVTEQVSRRILRSLRLERERRGVR